MTSNAKEKTEASNWLLEMMRRGERTWGASRELITPARAQAMLDQNPSNRSLKPAKIDQYADDMLAGRYEADNGETIKLAVTGELNDGQNRLNALVKTGMQIEMLVAFGLRRDSRFTVDIGAPRNAGDALGLQGSAYGGLLAAAARRIISYKRSGSLFNTTRISAPEVTKFAGTDKRLIENATWAHNAAKHFRIMGVTASEIASLYYLFDEKLPNKGWALTFFNKVGTGANLAQDDPIFTLRRVLMKGQIGTKKLSGPSKAELIIKAWNYWVRDEKTAQLNVTGNIPEIKGPKRGQLLNVAA